VEDSQKINVKEYFGKGTFVVPNYQRGYKWAVPDNEGKSSADYFIDSLIRAYRNKEQEYFIEAVTVVVEDVSKKIILVDGQQRTTTLFLLFAEFKDSEILKNGIEYDVREDSNKYLNDIIKDRRDELEKKEEEEIQDIYFFNVARELIKTKLKEANISSLGNDKENYFLKYIEEQVYLLYNPILEKNAVRTFITLNGLKAIMKTEDLIKSALLIKSSRPDESSERPDENDGKEWKINEDRGRLARNWDKWLYWWNKDIVRKYFGISKAQHPLYYLLVTYWNLNNKDKKKFTFENFKSNFISNSKDAKNHFEGLRKLQKMFEDLYNKWDQYNFLGLILKTANEDDKEKALLYFLNTEIKDKIISLEEYAKWSLVDATHNQIVSNNKANDEDKKSKAEIAIDLLNKKYVYWNEEDEDFKDKRKEFACRFLMLLNLLEDQKLERKFDFTIWDNRSLEHIYPKSKKGDLKFEENSEGSIHCIGNLVLLYGKDNSAFGNKDFKDKKDIFFKISTKEQFKSRNLLHTISVFAENDWGIPEIIRNKKKVIDALNDYYGLPK
jgi:uncharacterized protein with ParB-like and HNH nuclease domain